MEIGEPCWHERQRESSAENISVLHMNKKNLKEDSKVATIGISVSINYCN